jgi:hypothetical protein
MMSGHPKHPAKSSEGDKHPKILRPSPEVEEKMQPITRSAFDGLLQRAAQQHVPKPAQKHP